MQDKNQWDLLQHESKTKPDFLQLDFSKGCEVRNTK